VRLFRLFFLSSPSSLIDLTRFPSTVLTLPPSALSLLFLPLSSPRPAEIGPASLGRSRRAKEGRSCSTCDSVDGWDGRAYRRCCGRRSRVASTRGELGEGEEGASSPFFPPFPSSDLLTRTRRSQRRFSASQSSYRRRSQTSSLSFPLDILQEKLQFLPSRPLSLPW
jgi:hypothetical protein